MKKNLDAELIERRFIISGSTEETRFIITKEPVCYIRVKRKNRIYKEFDSIRIQFGFIF